MNLPEEFDFTQSNLQDYSDCPYRFYLRYILNIKWPALIVDDAVDFELRGQTGARFHRLGQQYLLGVPEERLTSLAESDPQPDVAVWWENFLFNTPPWLKGKRFIENTLMTRLLGYRLVAKYDLILVADENKVTIFDWKTSQNPGRKEWLLERVQTRFYRFVLTESAAMITDGQSINPEQITMNYWFAPHPESPVSLPYSQQAYQADKTFFQNLIQEITSKNLDSFEKTSDPKKCRFCVYRSHCDRGVEAGDLASFEALEKKPESFKLDTDYEEIAEIEF